METDNLRYFVTGNISTNYNLIFGAAIYAQQFGLRDESEGRENGELYNGFCGLVEHVKKIAENSFSFV